jgi:hypothetical protein
LKIVHFLEKRSLGKNSDFKNCLFLKRNKKKENLETLKKKKTNMGF